jgi:hypothetical protein
MMWAQVTGYDSPKSGATNAGACRQAGTTAKPVEVPAPYSSASQNAARKPWSRETPKPLMWLGFGVSDTIGTVKRRRDLEKIEREATFR